MISLGFVTLIVALFAALFFYERLVQPQQDAPQGLGLVHWLVSGNWAAKANSGLLIIGIGALIRWGILHSVIPTEIKLLSGMGASILLGLASFTLRDIPKRQALCLALAGASLGVAYLTTYSAYAFFYYLTDNTAFCLLAMVSAVGCLLALRTDALSIAILSMLGAYIAPCFALNEPGIFMLYGYYFALSLLCLMMILQKGWRPLIHLSFFFTLGGSLFFGWTNHYYSPQNFDRMLPVLLGMVILHIAMTVLEQRMRRQDQFDRIYIWVLGLTSLLLTCAITPNMHSYGWMTMLLMAIIWSGASLIVHILDEPGLKHYVSLAFIAAIASLALYVPDLPWTVVSVVTLTLLLVFAPRLQITAKNQQTLCMAILVSSLLHMRSSFSIFHDTNHLNIVYKLVTAGCLILAGYSASRRQIRLATLLGWMGAIWGGFTILNEIIDMLSPTMISWLLATTGACMMIGGHKSHVRILWLIGALLMASAAIKLAIFDFGFLDDLKNILAMIASAGVFLIVSWVAPYPPSAPADAWH